MVRGIRVDVWQSCYFNVKEYRTVRRIWALAQKGVVLPTGIVGDEAVPIEAIISASYDYPNGTRIAEVDEVYNVFSYRPGVSESADTLAPPKGVFCKNKDDQNLVSLQDVGIEWPNHFSVRVEASSSRSSEWQRFHLRYNLGRNNSTRILRYDYMPPGSEDFQSIIHDYTAQLTYTIDRRTGSCRITRKIDIPDVSPLRDPIEFFIKHENRLIFNPPQKAWEFNGYRCKCHRLSSLLVFRRLFSLPWRYDQMYHHDRFVRELSCDHWIWYGQTDESLMGCDQCGIRLVDTRSKRLATPR